MILLFVTLKGDPLKQYRYIAKESVGYRDSIKGIESTTGGQVASVNFPTEDEFFHASHTAKVTLL